MTKEQKKAAAAVDSEMEQASRVNQLLSRASIGAAMKLELNLYACDSSESGDSPFDDAEAQQRIEMRKPLSPQDVTGLEFSMAEKARRDHQQEMGNGSSQRLSAGSNVLSQSTISDASVLYDTNTTAVNILPTDTSDAASARTESPMKKC